MPSGRFGRGSSRHRGAGSRARLAAAVGLAALLASLSSGAPALAGGPATRLVVIEANGPGHPGEHVVRALGGRVESRLGIPRMFLASVPAAKVSQLLSAEGVAGASLDTRVALASVDGRNVATDLGGLTSIAAMIGAEDYWQQGFTGAGVDVALIDSGVAPVKGLAIAGTIINGPDLSFESQDPDLRYLDTFGHGTHMAGIIAGRDPGATPSSGHDVGHFLGIAPGARILSLKVADAFGTTDVSQVLAAIGWVVKHRHDHGMDIRVLNLSFGTDGVQSYRLDPLAFAVEHAWRKGIFVVAAAGNEGYGSAQLNDPAYDPMIMAVGASARQGTTARNDDTVAPFSSVGDARRHPDLVAPGTSVLSLRDPGSFIDRGNPTARVGSTPRLFVGSGTSQAAAVVSGAAALVIQQRPGIRPDQLKKLLTSTAYHLDATSSAAQGAGLIDLGRAFGQATPRAMPTLLPALGTGTLEGARGTLNLSRADITLTGESDIFGLQLDVLAWVERTVLGTAWLGGAWMGELWTGACWCEHSWAGEAWKGRSWTGKDWSGRSWTSAAWSGRSWTASGWSGGAWTGRSWTSATWSGDTWSSAGWGP